MQKVEYPNQARRKGELKHEQDVYEHKKCGNV